MRSHPHPHPPTLHAAAPVAGRPRQKKSICQHDLLPCPRGTCFPKASEVSLTACTQGEEQPHCRPGRKRAYLTGSSLPGPACRSQAWAEPAGRSCPSRSVCQRCLHTQRRGRKRGEARSLVYAVIILNLSMSNFYNQELI